MTGNALLVAFAVLTATALHAGDQLDNDPGPPYKFNVVDLVYRIDDLVYRVESIGGVVQDIEVKETPTEVRVEMAADVLFDFDKADLLPKADATLQQAADSIRAQAKGSGAVRIEVH